MTITQEKIDQLNTIVKIKLSPEDYNEKVSKAIKDHAKKVNLPGFRKGMVPAAHIKKMYGKSILVDEINNLLSDSLNNYIHENKLEVLGQPLPKMDSQKSYEWDFTEEYEFDYEMGLAPEFEVSFSAKDKFTRYIIKADDETIESRIKNLRRSYGKMTNPEVVEEGDNIVAELHQLASDGTLFEGGITNTTTLRLDLIKDKKISKSMIGLKKDDTLDIDIHKAFDGDLHRIAHILNIDEETAKDLKSLFRVTVKTVNRIMDAELNKEFFDKVFGEGKVNSEEDMKAEIRKEIEMMASDNSDRKLRNDIFVYAMDKFKLNLPDAFLKRWLKTMNQKEITEEQIESQYGDFAQNLKWTLIENKIVKNNHIEVKSEEVVDATKKKLDAQFRMYSPAPLSEEQLNQYAINYLQDRDRASKAFDEVKSLKVFEFLKTILTFEEKEISYAKFLEIAK